MSGTQSPDVTPHRGQDPTSNVHTTRTADVASSTLSRKAITGFAATGLVVALAIGTWTWNSSVAGQNHNHGQSPTVNSATAIAEKPETSTTDTADNRRRDDSLTNPSGGSTRDKLRAGEGQDTHYVAQGNSEPTVFGQDRNYDVAPLGTADPYLPPDSWNGDPATADAAPKTSTKKSEPDTPFDQLPDLNTFFPVPSGSQKPTAGQPTAETPPATEPGGTVTTGTSAPGTDTPDTGTPGTGTETTKPTTKPTDPGDAGGSSGGGAGGDGIGASGKDSTPTDTSVERLDRPTP